MTWFRQTCGNYCSHFIDGYFRDEKSKLDAATAARAQERIAAPLVFGAVTRFRLLGPEARSEYAGLTAEFRRDLDPDYLIWLLITPQPEDTGHWFVSDLIRSARLEVKNTERYADYAAFKRDADVLLGRVLSIFAAPIDLSVGVLNNAGLDIVGIVTARGKP